MDKIEILYKKTEDLIEYASNPRKNDHAVDKAAAIIREFGFLVPVLIKSDLTVIDGHLRLKAARKLELEEVPCVIVDDLSDTQIKALRISINKAAELADWDDELLAIELEGLADEDYDLELIGFDESELEGLIDGQDDTEPLSGEDEVPEVAGEPVVKLGEVWLLGKHRVMCGDSTSTTDVASLTEGKKADMVFTDPPYGISIVSADGSVGGGARRKYNKVLGDEDTSVALIAIEIALEICDGNILFWGGNYFTDILQPMPSWIVWDKQGGKHVSFADCEMAWTNTGQPARIFQHIWDGFRRDSERGEMRVHPTQKPVALCEECIKELGDGEIVLDLFLGSGSTLVACEKINRKCYGMELDPRYCDVIIKRWQEYTGEEATRESDGVLFDELLNDK